MFLEYGVNEHGELIHIADAARGRVDLRCPYCGVPLLARKGRQLAHHFAHDGPTCNEANRDFEALAPPLVDRFDMHGLNIDKRTFQALQRYHEGEGRRGDTDALLSHGLIKQAYPYNRGDYELTTKGKVPLGDAALYTFAGLQLELIAQRHDELETDLRRAAFGEWSESYRGYMYNPKPELVPAALVDLNIYRAQLRRYLGLSLYLLQIDHSAGTLYKIGVTGRDIEARIAEIQQDLKPLLTVHSITPLRILTARGMVERYALHRFREHRAPLGTLTEYLDLDQKQRRRVLSEFTRMGDFLLTDIYRATAPYMPLLTAIAAGDVSTVEAAIIDQRRQQEADRQRAAHIEATKAGMRAAQEAGQHIGRPPETDAELIAKYPHVVEALQAGLSLRQAAAAAGVSVNTVRKVKAAAAAQNRLERAVSDDDDDSTAT